MNLKRILAKKPEDLSDAEKAFLKANVAKLSEADRVKFAVDEEDVDDEGDADADADSDTDEDDEEGDEGKPAGGKKPAGDEGLDEESLKDLIRGQLEDIAEKQFDRMSTEIAAKYAGKIKAQRSKAFNGNNGKKEKGRDATREFLKSLFDNDVQTLRAREKALTTSTGDTPKGGYLIPPELQAEVMRLAETQYGLARREFRYLPFTGPGNSRTIPRLGSSVNVYWTNEGAKKTSTQPVFALVTQTMKKLAAIVPFTDELLEDSGINLTQLVAELFAEAVAKEEDTQFFNGTGSPWTGILNASGTGVVSLATGNTTGANVTADSLLALIDATPTAALAGAKFYMHRSWLSVFRKLKGSDGQYIFSPGSQGIEAFLGGYPVVTSDAFPAAPTTAAKAFVLFGNLNQAAIFGDKQQLRVKLLDQASITDTDGTTAINLAEQDMSALRIVERVGYVLAQPSAVSLLKTSAT